jgi:hypothetical protein
MYASVARHASLARLSPRVGLPGYVNVIRSRGVVCRKLQGRLYCLLRKLVLGQHSGSTGQVLRQSLSNERMPLLIPMAIGSEDILSD